MDRVIHSFEVEGRRFSILLRTEEPKKERKPRTQIPADQFLPMLKADPNYNWIDIDTELAKAQRWCEVNRRQCTQRFFRNWLDRQDRPIGATQTLPGV